MKKSKFIPLAAAALFAFVAMGAACNQTSSSSSSGGLPHHLVQPSAHPRPKLLFRPVPRPSRVPQAPKPRYQAHPANRAPQIHRVHPLVLQAPRAPAAAHPAAPQALSHLVPHPQAAPPVRAAAPAHPAAVAAVRPRALPRVRPALHPLPPVVLRAPLHQAAPPVLLRLRSSPPR